MHQTIAAMVTILGELRPEDHLTIVSFATNVTVWDAGASVIVVGSGIAGVATAHELAKRGFRVRLLERVQGFA